MSWKKEFFGDILLTKTGPKPVEEVLAGKKAIAIYFSAHWCPPCRGFTPVLAQFYQSVSGSGVEIVFVSCDSDDDSFKEYYGSMPWVAVPFTKKDVSEHLSQKFGIRGIPALIVVDGATGAIKDTQGRTTVTGPNAVRKALEMWT